VGTIRFSGKAKLRLAFIGIIVVLLLGLAWFLWLERPKDLTLRLKVVRNEVVDGRSRFLLRVEGARPYEVDITSLRYLRGQDPSPPYGTFSLHYYSSAREFFVDTPQYYSSWGNQAWKLQADVVVLAPEKTLSKVNRVIKDTWRLPKGLPKYGSTPRSRLALAKYLWQLNPKTVISKQVVTSELITNPATAALPASAQTSATVSRLSETAALQIANEFAEEKAWDLNAIPTVANFFPSLGQWQVVFSVKHRRGPFFVYVNDLTGLAHLVVGIIAEAPRPWKK
jgi:hypothetical protein